MDFLVGILAFLVKNSLFIFLVAFGAGLLGQNALNRGDIAKGKKLIWAAFIASALLCLTHAVVFVIQLSAGNPDLFTAVIGAIWGYFAWRDWRILQRLR